MAFLVVLVIIPALCLCAGWGLLRGLGPQRIQLDRAEALFVCGLIGVAALGWLALVAAELGFFSAGLLALLAVVLGAAGWGLGRRRGVSWGFSVPTVRYEPVFLLALMLVMAVLYLRPHQFLWGGADAGVYVNEGAQLSQSGRWLITQPDFADLAVSDYGMFFREHPPQLIPRFYYLPGFYVQDNQATHIIPQFYALHPVWLAVAHGLGGLDANLLMTPVWGLLGVLAVYFAVREAVDTRTAMLTALFLALTPTQIWFARYPTSEVLTQFLLLGGLYAFTRYLRSGEAWAGVLAGAALGEVMLVRADAYFLLGLLVVYAGYLRLRRQLDRRFWIVAAPMLFLAAYSLLHVVWQGWPYFYDNYLAASRLPLPWPILALGAAGVVLAFIAFDRKVASQPHWQDRWRPIGRALLTIAAVGLVVLAAYAYFIRPLDSDLGRTAINWYSDTALPYVEPLNMVRLGWYLSPLGLAVAVLGLAWLVRDRFSTRLWALLGVGLFFTVLYVYNTYNNPLHIYVMRRYVPAVFPVLALGLAYVVERLSQWRTIGRVLAAGLTVFLIGSFLYAGRFVNPQVDYQGGVAQYQAFAQKFPPHSIILFNNNAPVGIAVLFGTPLAYLDQQTAIDIQEDRMDQTRLSGYVQRWLAQGRSVFVVDGPQRVAGFCDVWQCRSLGTTHLTWSELEQSYEHFPQQVYAVDYPLTINQVQAVTVNTN